MHNQTRLSTQKILPALSEAQPRGISIPAKPNRGTKLSAQPDDNDQTADLRSLNSRIAVPMDIGRFLPLAVAITAAVKEVHQGGPIQFR